MARVQQPMHVSDGIVRTPARSIGVLLWLQSGLLGLNLNNVKDCCWRPSRSHCRSACPAPGVPRTTYYRRHRSAPGRQQPRSAPAGALCKGERERIVATLPDEGQYLCSEHKMYRILAASQPVRERRNQLTHPSCTKPELVATGPNET